MNSNIEVYVWLLRLSNAMKVLPYSLMRCADRKARDDAFCGLFEKSFGFSGDRQVDAILLNC